MRSHPVTICLDVAMHDQLRERAALEERSVSWLVRRAVRRDLAAQAGAQTVED